VTETAAADAELIVSKSEFARLVNVSPPRVSQWIEGGKISGEALVGEGRSSRIRAAVACAQLKRGLDLSQRLGNGITTRLELPAQPASLPSVAPSSSSPAPLQPAVDPIEEQLKREKLEEWQRKNRIAARQEAESSGRLTDAELAQQLIGRAVAKTVGIYEAGRSDMAEALAAYCDKPKREILQILQQEDRKLRANAAADLRRQALEVPELLELELGADEQAPEQG
jgi:DNA-binding transcriptional regulator YdaS (Cro superfamily)